MDQFNFVAGLLSIITGLALSDMGLSLHRLLKRRDRVRWDPLVLGTAAYLAFVIVRYWFQTWSVHDFPKVTSLFFFLGLLVENFLLFLIAASALPDEEDVGNGPVDLRLFGQKQHRYLWSLFAIYAALWGAHGLYFSWTFGGRMTAHVLLIFLLPPALGAAMALTRQRPGQWLLFAALIVHEAWWILQSGF